ncbi:nitroreductase family protein [Paenibacillus sp. DMB20]|uniref:nitroreductase family protein n=1 Tax=Paenibacillus sp. DMB20 TaxID=1642570 RepID=UPI000627B533|nr:nitroreductase family protein [Paenibacillus sp. DMB20]KKO52869.1 NAD(P)H nitroreductase [Paenibacillus sp. DMB20]KKO53765.1 NAD(P)H nitroreductase [Paenibacillus sp. DMB20]
MNGTANSFTELLKSRRSAMKFIPDVKIGRQELEEMFNLVKYAPSAFNLQHAHYAVVTDSGLKEKVYEAAYRQYKVLTSSAVIVVLGDLEAYHDIGPINEGLLSLGIIDQFEFDKTVREVHDMYESRGDGFKRDEAIRNASLSAMQFMLIAKERGWDTCPMIGFDPEAVRVALQIDERYVPVMLITLGKEDTGKQRPRGYRKPNGEFVTYYGE